MKTKLLILSSFAMFSGVASAADVLNHKSPYCGCCSGWTDYMKEKGHDVEEVLHEDMSDIKTKFNITPELASCHTAEIEGFVFEGHIPSSDIEAFLANPPKGAVGLAVPGMPLGSPGMNYGDEKHDYTVYSFNAQGEKTVFNEYTAQ